MQSKPIAGFPSRTAACLALRAKGLTDRQIADELGLYPSDVSALIATKLRRMPGRPARENPLHENGRTVVVSNDVLDALAPHAARRGISVNQIARNLLAQVIDDAIVDAVLDDADEIVAGAADRRAA